MSAAMELSEIKDEFTDGAAILKETKKLNLVKLVIKSLKNPQLYLTSLTENGNDSGHAPQN
jgi:hypothetical protein